MQPTIYGYIWAGEEPRCHLTVGQSGGSLGALARADALKGVEPVTWVRLPPPP
jgi:hypothetical protein